MNAIPPAPGPSRLDRLVQALCAVGGNTEKPVALLVQKNESDAVIVNREWGDILILLETDAGPMSAEELEARVPAALCREREDVLAGLRTQYSVLVRIVTPGWRAPPAVPPAEAVSHGLLRPFGILRLDDTGVTVESAIEVPGRQAKPDMLERVRKILEAVSGVIDDGRTLPPMTREALEKAEHRGEEIVASEGIFERLKMRPPGVIGIALLLLLIHGAKWLTPDPVSTQVVLRMGANQGELVVAGEIWRIITAGYIHQDLSHLVGNAVVLWIFGSFVEAAFGTGRFLLAYTFLVAASEGITALAKPEQVGYGASGGVMGLVAFVAMMNWRGSKRAPPFSGSGWGCLGVIFITNEVFHAFDPQVSFVAHFGGALSGALLAATRILEWGLGPLEADPRQARPPVAGWALGFLAFLITLGAMATALDRGRPWSVHEPGRMVPVRWEEGGLELEIPASLARRQERESGDGWVRFRAGDARLDVLVLSFLARDHEFADQDGEAATAHLKDTLESEGHTIEPGTMTTIPTGSRTMAVWARKGSDNILLRYLGAIGGREVDVQVSLLRSAPEEWQSLAHKAVYSLRRIP